MRVEQIVSDSVYYNNFRLTCLQAKIMSYFGCNLIMFDRPVFTTVDLTRVLGLLKIPALNRCRTKSYGQTICVRV